MVNRSLTYILAHYIHWLVLIHIVLCRVTHINCWSVKVNWLFSVAMDVTLVGGPVCHSMTRR